MSMNQEPMNSETTALNCEAANRIQSRVRWLTGVAGLATLFMTSCTTQTAAVSRSTGLPRIEGEGFFGNRHIVKLDRGKVSGINASDTKVVVDISDQQATLYHGDTPVLVTAVSTGKNNSTPTGHFRVQGRTESKKSTFYGQWYDASGVPIPGATARSRRPSGGARFEHADMPYWMAINGHVGMHVGLLPGYPASHGCIRVPSKAQAIIYSKTKIGTPVIVQH